MPTKPAIHNDAAADAGAERQQDQVVDVFARAEPLLAERRGVGVVLQNDRLAEPAADLIAQCHAFERRQVVAVGDDALLHADEAGHGHADAGEPFLAKLVLQHADGCDDVVDHRVATLLEVCRAGMFA